MARKLKIGDVVQLKSGGPEMTVTGLSQEDKSLLNCTYYDNNAFRFTGISDVPPESLNIIKQPKQQ